MSYLCHNLSNLTLQIFFQMGAVDPMAFDKMIEAAASAPRRYGLAPKSSEMFPTHMVSKIGCLTNKNNKFL